MSPLRQPSTKCPEHHPSTSLLVRSPGQALKPYLMPGKPETRSSLLSIEDSKAPNRISLGLQVYKYYLRWALKCIHMTYFGLPNRRFGAICQKCRPEAFPHRSWKNTFDELSKQKTVWADHLPFQVGGCEGFLEGGFKAQNVL